MPVPVVETPRLTLRGHRAEDFDGYAEHLADPEARRHLPGLMDRRDAWRALAGGLGMWELFGGGWWAIELRSTGEVVGAVGAFFREPHAPGARLGDLELGWTVYREHWRRGYASEAASAALAFGLARHGLARAIAHIDRANEPSIRTAERVGMRLEGEVDFYGTRLFRYAASTRAGRVPA